MFFTRLKTQKAASVLLILLSCFCLLFATGCAHVRLHPERPGRKQAQEPTAEAEEVLPETEPEEPEVIEPPLPEDMAEPSEDEPAQEEDEEQEEERIPLAKYDELLTINPYVAGWLTIDDSVIDDPVVYTPGSQNYFLHRDIDGSDTSKGTLFIAVDWQDNYHNTLIYGHNMKDRTAFGSLAKFADESYGRNHPVLHFDTLYDERDYELYAVFYSQIEEDELETEEDRDEADKEIVAKAIAKIEEEAKTQPQPEPQPEAEPTPVEIRELTLFDIDLHQDFYGEDIYRQEKDEDNGRFRYYYYTNLSDRNDFEYYAKNVKERALYDTGVEAEWGDDFITLSTCSYQVKNGRFVVVGIRKNHETQD